MPSEGTSREAMERIFSSRPMETPAIQQTHSTEAMRGATVSDSGSATGSIVGNRRTGNPGELDVRASISHAVLERGQVQPQVSDLHERVRKPKTGTRYLFVIDSSGSHAAQERMRLVKGAAVGLLARSFKRDDEVAMIVFRGTEAQVLLEPTRIMDEAITALEYLPTGGRTPLAHALHLARSYVTPSTLLILLTDGRANVALHLADPWQEALEIAGELRCNALVIDTENAAQALGQSRKLADALGARYVTLASLHDPGLQGMEQLIVP